MAGLPEFRLLTAAPVRTLFLAVFWQFFSPFSGLALVHTRGRIYQYQLVRNTEL